MINPQKSAHHITEKKERLRRRKAKNGANAKRGKRVPCEVANRAAKKASTKGRRKDCISLRRVEGNLVVSQEQFFYNRD